MDLASVRAVSIRLVSRDHVEHAEVGEAGLAQAEHVAGAAQAEVGFGDLEAVGGLAQDVEAFLAALGERGLVEQEAAGGLLAATDAAAQLVELGEAEFLGVFDDHDGGFGHIDADFDHGGGDEDAGFAVAEFFERAVAILRRHAAVDEFDRGVDVAGEDIAALDGGGVACVFRVDGGADPEGAFAAIDGAGDGLHDFVDAACRGRRR